MDFFGRIFKKLAVPRAPGLNTGGDFGPKAPAPFDTPYKNLSQAELMARFSPQVWVAADPDIRQGLLQEVSNRYTAERGLPQVQVIVSRQGMASNCNGFYNYENHYIQLNPDNIRNPYKALGTVVHETQHHCQDMARQKALEDIDQAKAQAPTNQLLHDAALDADIRDKVDGQTALLACEQQEGYGRAPDKCETETEQQQWAYYQGQGPELDSNNAGFAYVTANKSLIDPDGGTSWNDYLQEVTAYYDSVANNFRNNAENFRQQELAHVQIARESGLSPELCALADEHLQKGPNPLQQQALVNTEKANRLKYENMVGELTRAADQQTGYSQRLAGYPFANLPEMEQAYRQNTAQLNGLDRTLQEIREKQQTGADRMAELRRQHGPEPQTPEYAELAQNDQTYQALQDKLAQSRQQLNAGNEAVRARMIRDLNYDPAQNGTGQGVNQGANQGTASAAEEGIGAKELTLPEGAQPAPAKKPAPTREEELNRSVRAPAGSTLSAAQTGQTSAPTESKMTPEQRQKLLDNVEATRQGNEASRFREQGLSDRPVKMNSKNMDKLLEGRGLSRQDSENLKQSFEPGTVQARHAKYGEEFVTTSGQQNSSGVFVSEKPLGSTPEQRIDKGALPPTNTAEYQTKVQLDRDQDLLTGKIAPQPEFSRQDPQHRPRTGGAEQVVTDGGYRSGAVRNHDPKYPIPVAASEEGKAEAPKAQEQPKVEEPKVQEQAKAEATKAPEQPKVAETAKAPEQTKPQSETVGKAQDTGKTNEAANGITEPSTGKTQEQPKAEEPKVQEQPKAEATKAPEQPKVAETAKAPEQTKPQSETIGKTQDAGKTNEAANGITEPNTGKAQDAGKTNEAANGITEPNTGKTQDAGKTNEAANGITEPSTGKAQDAGKTNEAANGITEPSTGKAQDSGKTNEAANGIQGSDPGGGSGGHDQNQSQGR